MALIPLGPAGFLPEAYQAITDFHFYRRVFEQPFLRTLLYLLYLSAAVALVLTVTYAWQYGPQAREFLRWAQQSFPPLEVENGKLVVHAKQPLIKKYPAEQPITFVFDTTGTYMDPESVEEPAVLLTEESIYFCLSGQTQVYRWEELGPFRLSGEEFGRWESFFNTWTYFPPAYSLLLIYSLILKTIQACLLIPFGLLASAREGVWLRSSRYFTIAFYGLTPAVAIDLMVTITGLNVSYFLLIYLGTAALYTYLGTQKCLTVE